MENDIHREPETKAKRGRPRKHFYLADGRTRLDPPTFARIKAMQAAGYNSQYVADAMQLNLALVNKIFGSPHYYA